MMNDSSCYNEECEDHWYMFELFSKVNVILVHHCTTTMDQPFFMWHGFQEQFLYNCISFTLTGSLIMSDFPISKGDRIRRDTYEYLMNLLIYNWS